MTKNLNSKTDLKCRVYQIRTEGHLDCHWADWFNGLTIVQEDDGTTLLTGPVRDQAELYSLLKKVRDLGMPLLSVNCVEPHQADATKVSPPVRSK